MPKLLLALALVCLLACRRTDPPPPTQPAFYFWKTNLKISPAESALLDSVGCQKIYVKFLDIGRGADGLPEPLAQIQVVENPFFSQLKIVPCVFVTNETFRGLDAESIEVFAEKTARLLADLGQNFSKKNLPNPLAADAAEVQFDCDWTASTRDQFFLFLKKVKNQLPKNVVLSATVRLHQFKSPEKTGVPPVERGMLMFYNTGDIENWATDNSIFDAAEVEKFVAQQPKKYPLPLDLALPAFSWTVVFRDDEFFKILPNRRRDSDFSDSKFFKKLTINRFEVLDDTFCDGIFLRQGDLLRVERMSPEALRAARAAAGRVPADLARTVAFFHLDSAGLAGFRAADFL